MKGERPLGWLWTWLGFGSVGELYEVLPSVQPVAVVNGVEMPRQQRQFNTTPTALINGTVTIVLPRPTLPDGSVDRTKSRVWTNFLVSRTVAAATDITFLHKTVAGLNCPIISMLGTFAVNTALPMIGGLMVHFAIPWQGTPPVLVGPDDSMSINVVAAAAGGTFSGIGLYFDVPSAAPLPSTLIMQ